MWEWQFGRVWIAIRFPTFWLYSRNRADYIRKSKPHNFLASRAWLYQWPGFIRIVEPDE